MSRHSFTSSKPDHWVSPRSYTDAGLRQHHYGKIEPMDARPRFSWIQALVIAVGFWGALFLFALVTP